MNKDDILKRHLTQRQYEIYHLKYKDGKKHWQIGEILGVSRVTVTRTLQNIYKKIEKIRKAMNF